MDKKTFVGKLVCLCREANVDLCLSNKGPAFAKNNHDSSDYLWMIPIDSVLEGVIDSGTTSSQQSDEGKSNEAV